MAAAVYTCQAVFNPTAVLNQPANFCMCPSHVARNHGCGLWPHTTNYATLPPHGTYSIMDLSVYCKD